MSDILKTIAVETDGKSFGTRKLCHDEVIQNAINYDDHQVFVWKRRGETVDYRESVDLTKLADSLFSNNIPPKFKFFLDGTRRTYKVDDIAYHNQIYPIIAGQVAVGCCFRENREIKAHDISRSYVLALPNTADPDGQHSDLFFRRLVEKINGIPSLKRHNIEFSEILRYYYAKNDPTKLEDKGIAKIQEYMITLEKDHVSTEF